MIDYQIVDLKEGGVDTEPLDNLWDAVDNEFGIAKRPASVLEFQLRNTANEPAHKRDFIPDFVFAELQEMVKSIS